MPTTPNQTLIESLRRLALTTLAYVVALALVAVTAPTILVPMPVATLLPQPPPVVARAPVASPPAEPAPNLSKTQS